MLRVGFKPLNPLDFSLASQCACKAAREQNLRNGSRACQIARVIKRLHASETKEQRPSAPEPVTNPPLTNPGQLLTDQRIDEPLTPEECLHCHPPGWPSLGAPDHDSIAPNLLRPHGF